MRTIEYTNDGDAIADHNCEAMARFFLCEAEIGDITVKVSTENFITIVRALVYEGYCSHTNVQFLFQGKYIKPNEHGRLPDWPVGFCDAVEKALMRMLRIPESKK